MNLSVPGGSGGHEPSDISNQPVLNSEPSRYSNTTRPRHISLIESARQVSMLGSNTLSSGTLHTRELYNTALCNLA